MFRDVSGLVGNGSHIGLAEEKHPEMRIIYIFNTQQTRGNKKLSTFSIKHKCVIGGKDSNICPRPNLLTEFVSFLHLRDMQLLSKIACLWFHSSP
jgi:hypothetical protein